MTCKVQEARRVGADKVDFSCRVCTVKPCLCMMESMNKVSFVDLEISGALVLPFNILGKDLVL